MGNDALMMAAILGRVDNVRFWLTKYETWNLERRNKIVGGTVLGHTLYAGSNKLKMVKVLVEAGANLEYSSYTGGTALHNIAECEDSDPNVLKFVIAHVKDSASLKSKPTTLLWKCFFLAAKSLYRLGISSKSGGVVNFFARESGTTPLHRAIVRGDLEIVRMLLDAGADVNVKSDLGMDALGFCEFYGPFETVRKEILKERGSSSSRRRHLTAERKTRKNDS